MIVSATHTATTPSHDITEEPEPSSLESRIDAACKRIAPLWPLKHFVAVNPFLGFARQSFQSTAAHLKRTAHTRMLMPRAFYREALADGTIDDRALSAAMTALPTLATQFADPYALRSAAMSETPGTLPPAGVVATVAEVLDAQAGGDRYLSLVSFMLDEISGFCAAYFDEGQSSWRMPVRHLRPYAAWRALIRHDLNPECMGIDGFRKTVLALPADPVEAIAEVLEELGIPSRAVDDYLFRALFDIGGWAAYARYIGWSAELDGERDDTLRELLAIRIAWGYGLFRARTDTSFLAAWKKAMLAAEGLSADVAPERDRDLALDLLLQEAYDMAYRTRLIEKLAKAATGASLAGQQQRPAVQAAFCIDVRSEVFRRALESASPGIETIGFAGFFGFPIEYVPIGQEHGGAQCPVLLKPAFTVCEAVNGVGESTEQRVLGLRLLRRRASKAWKSFKLSAVSSFAYVETAGLTFAAKLATDSLALTRPVPSPSVDGIDRAMATRLGPRLAPKEIAGRQTGFTPESRIAMAEAVLKAMSMTGPFARLVLLAGHGSTTVNNPHASGLDCGACGGHTGEANARVAAAVLNDRDVRGGLAKRGIEIPDDCWFLGALHDTTTDEVRIFDEAAVPASLASDLADLKHILQRAAALARSERSGLLGLRRSDDIDRAIIGRSRDWSQVRPEWGLAGNAAFIAAPRALTRGLDLEGRAFLHSYEHSRDQGNRVLELIMTAPMVVASWINLQYYGSTANNAVFGSGNKVLHNVVGQLGVLEGNAGDLRTGLPWQSVHDGTRLVHKPLRLNVFIAAPEAAMDAVLSKHAGVRDLVANGWVFLHALADDGQAIRRWHGTGDWRQA
ncbi:MAG: DUF2309 domain-containing protein [Hyphomicrobiaceae bacterium]